MNMTASKQSTATELPHRVVATPLESVKFVDGMVVTADDLESAMNYPATMLQSVLRLYFGCGVVCGMAIETAARSGRNLGPFELCIQPGMAVDCNGFPLELCNPITLNLEPDPCALPEDIAGEICIAIQRVTSDEAPSDGCSCHTDDPKFQCTRTRTHIKVKAFATDDLPERGLCALPAPIDSSTGPKSSIGSEYGTGETGSPPTLCDCLTECPSCECTGDPWILLGCVSRNADALGAIDLVRRKYIKPTRCACTAGGQIEDLAARLTQLENGLQAARSSIAASATPPVAGGSTTPGSSL